MADMDQLFPKKVADRYLKREVLGEGTYGVVYKAIDTQVPSLLNFYPANFEISLNLSTISYSRVLGN